MAFAPRTDHLEPFFITGEVEAEMKAGGYVFEPPTHVSTTNTRKLFGLQEGETVAEAIARAQRALP
jgi:hypothetical protein